MLIKTIDDVCRLARDGFSDWPSEGCVNTTYRNGLLLFNYTHEAQFKKAFEWTPLERLSRGLIIHQPSGKVVARPFDKFWNLGEIDPAPGSQLREVTVKWDGSLGILYFWGERWNVATRGSFDSEQAEWATKRLRHYHTDILDIRNTYLVEIIYPENRVVIDYGQYEGLIMIGMRNTLTGEDYFHDQYIEHAMRAGFPTTDQIVTFSGLEDVWSAAEALSANEEGYVCRFDDGTRLKVKGGAYRTAHKWIAGMTPKAVFDAMVKDQIDDLRPNVPDIYKGLFESYVNDVVADLEELKARIEAIYEQSPRNGSRKDFALWVTEHYKQDAAYLFARHDSRSLLPLLYRERYN